MLLDSLSIPIRLLFIPKFRTELEHSNPLALLGFSSSSLFNWKRNTITPNQRLVSSRVVGDDEWHIVIMARREDRHGNQKRDKAAWSTEERWAELQNWDVTWKPLQMVQWNFSNSINSRIRTRERAAKSNRGATNSKEHPINFETINFKFSNLEYVKFGVATIDSSKAVPSG